MLPLVRRILSDVRTARCRQHYLERRLAGPGLTRSERGRFEDERADVRRRVDELLSESDHIGVEVTPGVRCEALFPFEHQWIGPQGDGKIRAAFFVYSDEHPTITDWFFKGWPDDRRKIWPQWWSMYRARPAVAQPEPGPHATA